MGFNSGFKGLIVLVLVVNVIVPIPLVARCKAYFCGRSLSGIEGLNPAGSWDVGLL